MFGDKKLPRDKLSLTMTTACVYDSVTTDFHDNSNHDNTTVAPVLLTKESITKMMENK